MSYFAEQGLITSEKKNLINKSSYGPKISGFRSVPSFQSGNVLNVVYRQKNFTYSFQGICISLRKKKINSPETSLILRNVIARVGVELSISFYSSRCFLLKLQDFKRKKKVTGRSKLYLIRHKANQQSLVL